MLEKRKVERFDLRIETMLQVQDDAILETSQKLVSRDISSGGVYLTTERPLPVGTRVDLDFLLIMNELNGRLKDKSVNISTSGKVIRTDEQGFAVEFDKHHKVSPLK